MSRIAVVAAAADMRAVLAAIADTGLTDLEAAPEAAGEAVEALHRLEQDGRRPAGDEMRLARDELDVAATESARRWDLLAGEVQLIRRLAASVQHGDSRIAVGWAPASELAGLADAVEPLGGALVELPLSPLREPPTLLRPPGIARPFVPLVSTYGVLRYSDLDPTTFAGLTFVLMFGMMFGDVGDGLLVVLGGLLLRAGRPAFLRPYRRAWPVVAACGAASTLFGALYGEFFGPTGLVPALWMEPLQDPARLLVVGVLAGLVLLGISHVLGAVNRWREGGPGLAIYAASGVAGLLLFSGLAAAAAGVLYGAGRLAAGGGAAAVLALVLLFAGYLNEAGMRPIGWLQAFIETFDALVRLVSNSVSFARLAAFGVVHCAIGQMVWQGTVALWHGPVGIAAALLLFAVGSAVGLALEGLVAAIQALRLEYYELFSRIFGSEGRPFRPWHIPLASMEDPT